MRKTRDAFTLIELLVVMAIITLLIAVLIPTLNKARQQANATRCLANLHGIGEGLVTYENLNGGMVVPSYNMPRPGTFAANAGDVIDGWAAILDRDGVVPGSKGLTNNVFFCPNTLDIDGMAGGQTLYDQNKPSGYQDWPTQFTAAGGDSATKTDPTLPVSGFGDGNGVYEHEIRCGYCLNAYNPIGSSAVGPTAPPCPYYTQSVGYGPYADGSLLPQVKTNRIARPAALIVATDGIYMGRQSVVRLGEQNRRVAYRHPGAALTVSVNGTNVTFANTVSNAVFADGHAEGIRSDKMPHGSTSNATQMAENNGPYSFLVDH